MLNPDGVYIGNYRTTSLGYDLNRHWQYPNWKEHPTITALKYLLRQIDNNSYSNLDYYIDLHSHTNAYNAFMYCNQYFNKDYIVNKKSNKINDVISLLPKLLDLYSSSLFSFNKTKFCSNPKKIGSARRSMEIVLNKENTIILCLLFLLILYISLNTHIKHLPI